MRAPRPVTRQYTLTAKWLHWLAAFLLLSVMSVAAGFAFIAPADRAAAIPVHASLGLVVVGLTLVRLAWRRIAPPPAPPETAPAWMRTGARLGHRMLYALILVQGALGLWLAALSPVGIRVFEGFDLATLSPASPGSLAYLREVHFAVACLLGATVFAHAAAALWHHVLLRDDVLVRMIPFGGLWQRLAADEARRLERFPSQRLGNWPKRLPPRGAR